MNWPKGMQQRAVVMIVMLTVALVYWFVYRASQVKRNCAAEAELNPLVIAGSSDLQRQHDLHSLYVECLARNGLK